MDQRTRSIAVGALAIFILAVIVAVIFFLTRTKLPATSTGEGALITPPPFYVTPSPFPTSVATSSSTRNPSAVSSLNVTPTVTSSLFPGNVSSNITGTKSYTGTGFIINYPQAWGLLTCGNSSNIEFDPVSGQDLPNIACNRAVKPITVLVQNSLLCLGQATKIGVYNVVKSVVTKDDGITTNRWCVDLGAKKLDITDRVANTGARATATQDYSTQIETLIQNIKVSSGS